MTHTTDIVQLSIKDSAYETVYNILYTGVILNKKEILKWLTYSIEDLDFRKYLKLLVNDNAYTQESFANMNSEISRALY